MRLSRLRLAQADHITSRSRAAAQHRSFVTDHTGGLGSAPIDAKKDRHGRISTIGD